MPKRRFSDSDVRLLRELFDAGVSTAELEARFGISRPALNALLRGDKRSAAGGPLRPRRGRLRPQASPEERLGVLRERLLDRIEVDPVTGCWIVSGPLHRGYATLTAGANVGAHRAAWEVFRGPIPPGLMNTTWVQRDDGGWSRRCRPCGLAASRRWHEEARVRGARA